MVRPTVEQQVNEAISAIKRIVFEQSPGVIQENLLDKSLREMADRKSAQFPSSYLWTCLSRLAPVNWTHGLLLSLQLLVSITDLSQLETLLLPSN